MNRTPRRLSRGSDVRPNLMRLEDRVNPVNVHGGEGATFNLSATGTVGASEGSIGGQSYQQRLIRYCRSRDGKFGADSARA